MQKTWMTTPLTLAIAAALAALLAACNIVDNLPFIATPTPTPTTTPTPTLTPTLTPTPTPTPTVPPTLRIESGEYALFIGDWDAAMREFNFALETDPGSDATAAALLGIGRTQHAQGKTFDALHTLRGLVKQYPNTPSTSGAYYFLAQVFTGLQRYEEAADAYQRYLDLRPGVIDGYVHEWRGDALLSAGEYLSAIEAYNAALIVPRLDAAEPIRIKIARSLSASGDYQSALTLYEDIYQNTTNDFFRAQVNLLRGEIHLLLGEPELAYAYYRDSVENYPLSYHTYLSLVELVNAGAAVSELDRGLVDYFAGQYVLAIRAFDRYLLNADETHDGTAHYYKALALRAIGSPESARDEFDVLIETHATADPFWDDAWDEKGYTQWAFLGDYEAAIETFLGFTARVPGHARAGEFLFFAAQVTERDGQLGRAAQLWERVPDEYPTHPLAYRARFLAGVAQYRLGKHGPAQGNFERALELAATPSEQAAATLWVGKTQVALGFPDRAQATWQRAASYDPTGYYSERALDLLAGRDSFVPPQMYDFVIDWEAEKAEAEAWIREVFALPDGVDLTSPGPLAADPRLGRGTELWRLGLYESARAEFENLRTAIQFDPADNYRLANYLLDLGLYRTAIFCTRQILTLAGMDDAATMGAPPYFNHIRFKLYYDDLVLPLANEYDLHPLLLYSVIRQESLFEGFVRSVAGARGLMQIIPATGQGIYNNLGWPPGYTAEDLYRPVINVPYGADYLTGQIERFGGNASGAPPSGITVYAALAAYNGGPGNSAVWLSLADNACPECTAADPDLFLELVRFGETRNYIRGVYEIFAIYRRIYDRTP